MTLTISDVKKIYQTWDLDSDPSDDLQDWLSESLNHPDRDELIELSKFFIEDFSPSKSPYWLNWSIKYLRRGEITKEKMDQIAYVVTNYEKFKYSGSARDSAARFLGDMSHYPNDILRNAISFKDHEDESEVNQLAVIYFRAAAYGGYVMTATDFRTGLEAEREIKASGEIPTVGKAEQIITEWREKHG